MVQAQNLTATLVYTYNADGLRVAQAQSVSSVESVDTFTWDWATPVPELLSDGESLYLIGHDTLGWQNEADWTFVLPDALGSVRQKTDAVGAVMAVREWSPYGEEIGGARTGLGFTGEWFDSYRKLLYLRARWYDGGTGRFTSPDPIVPDYQNPPSIHAYVYVVNNVINLTDPSGATPERGWIYSCNCGFIDPNHFDYSETSMAAEIIQKVKDAGPEDRFPLKLLNYIPVFNLYSALCRMGCPLIQANVLPWVLLADERRMEIRL